jgi:hypothetical protein
VIELFFHPRRRTLPDSSNNRRDAARKRANAQFTASEQRDAAIRSEIEKERAAVTAKTAKLKALRLAREAEEREAAEKETAAAPKPAAKPRKRKPAKA